MQKNKQMSESILVGTILALSGGFMDAYSYLARGHVFANAQTGNMLLFGVNLAEGHINQALRYFLPFFAFAVGIALTEVIRKKEIDRLHWRQLSVLMEAGILLVVAFIPTTMNTVANILTSFACGIQVESFRKINGNGIATTMCIGNMRSGTENLCRFIELKDKKSLSKVFLYYGIIIFFMIGAVIGNAVIKVFAERSILCCSLLLMITFIFMFKVDE